LNWQEQALLSPESSYCPERVVPRRAFTLIELLIVVAIIAILAAIAVPNFLEAQTRAKVAAAQSNMRTISTGLESYHVDQNRYPAELGPVQGPAGSYVGQPSLNGYGQLRLWGWKTAPPSLSTPVSYLSSLPQDPFKQGAASTIPPTDGRSFASGDRLDLGFVYLDIAGWVNFENPQFEREWANSTFGRWGLVSLGPDQTYNVPQPTPDNSRQWVYDPTNGTVSSGIIVRTQNQVDVQ